MKSKFFSLRLLVTLIAWLALLMPTAKLKADNSPLCFTARNGSVEVRFSIKQGMHTIQYSTNGSNWSTYYSNTSVNLNANEKVYFRAATNQTTAIAFGSEYYPYYTPDSFSIFHFSSVDGGTVEGSGNIMSLYGPSCPNLQLPSFAFAWMFYQCTKLTIAPMLPATNLGSYCYWNMFYYCSSLASAPMLPATTLANKCYSNMFRGCSSLTIAPDLPATTLANDCYEGMFGSCSSLTTPPSLPATSLRSGCYKSMFGDCRSLTSAPTLPATTMIYECYSGMFSGCSSLATAPALPAMTLADDCYFHMFYGCRSLTIPPALPATTLAEECYYEMFSHCTSLLAVPELPATTLEDYCYYYMFDGCTSLVVNIIAPGQRWKIPAKNASWTSISYMFRGTGGTMNGTPSVNTDYYVSSDPNVPLCFSARNGNVTVRFDIKNVAHTIQYSNDNLNWSNYTSNSSIYLNENGIVYFRAATNQTTAQAFGGWNTNNCSRFYFTTTNGGTVEASGNIMSLYGPDCPNLQLQPRAFKSLFVNCTILKTTPKLAATYLADYCYSSMFSGCKSLTAAPTLPATTLANWCYDEMFYGCTALSTVPVLPATSLAEGCYYYMFKGCTSLTAAPKLPATILAPYCYQEMFEECTNLNAKPELPATNLAKWCYFGMFSYCTSLISAPELPATTLADSCYTGMFWGCTSLTTAPELPAIALAKYCYKDMFYGCTALTTAPKLSATTLANSCYNGMFKNCTSLSTAPELPATTLANWCYYYMFDGCTSLKVAPELPATTLSDGCYENMFFGCTSLATPPTLPAKTLTWGCYMNMFYGCTALTTVPELPATSLSTNCYQYMFVGCTSLKVNYNAPGKAWSIPASATSASGWNTSMFSNTGGDFKGSPTIGTTYYIASGSSKSTSGDGDWNDPTKWPNGKIPGGADEVTISSNITIPEGVNAHCESINITGSGVLTVAPSATLHATTITNTDPTKFIIQADSASTGTVRFTSGSPKVTVQMCLKGSYEEGANENLIPDWQYRGFIGTPEASQTLKDIVIYKWNETNNNVNCWSSFYNGFEHKSATGTFTPWNGFSVANFDTAKAIRSYTTTLLPTNVDHTYNLTKTTTGNGHQDAQNCGLNLLTNSYSAPINMSAGVTSSNIESTFYFFNTRTQSEYNSDKNAAITTYPTAVGSYLQATSPYIAAGQSFAVKATADGASLTIPATAVSTVSSGAMYAPAKNPGMVKITVESEEAIDEVYLLQMDECTSGFDNGFDGTKMFSTKAHQIYAQNEYGQTAVNADKTLLGQFVGFKPMSGAPSVQMTIAAIDLEGYDELYLYDYVTDTYIEITDEENSYTFTSTGEETPRRFQIVGKSSDGTEYNPKAEPRIEVVGEEIYLMNFERGDAMVILTDAAGRTLWSVNAKDGNTFTLPHLAAGVYFVSCGKTTAKYVQH